MELSKKQIIGMVVVGAGGLLWLYGEQIDDEHEALVADQVEVVKAANSFGPGTPLTKDRITTEKVPRKFLPPDPLLESELNIYLGTPILTQVEEGAMLLTSDFTVGAMPIAPTLVSPLVIKTANLELSSESPVNAGQAALAAVAKAGGYIVSSDIQTSKSFEQFSMVARVPAQKFESMLIEVNELGEITQRRIRGAGVAADVQKLERKIGNADFKIEGLRDAQAKSAKKSQKRDTIEIVAGDVTRRVETRTTNTETDARIDADLADANYQLAELQDELGVLHQETALSTIELTIRQPIAEVLPPAPPTAMEELSADFMRSTRAVWHGIFGTIRLLASMLPVLIFLGPALGFALWVRRKARSVMA